MDESANLKEEGELRRIHLLKSVVVARVGLDTIKEKGEDASIAGFVSGVETDDGECFKLPEVERKYLCIRFSTNMSAIGRHRDVRMKVMNDFFSHLDEASLARCLVVSHLYLLSHTSSLIT